MLREMGERMRAYAADWDGEPMIADDGRGAARVAASVRYAGRGPRRTAVAMCEEQATPVIADDDVSGDGLTAPDQPEAVPPQVRTVRCHRVRGPMNASSSTDRATQNLARGDSAGRFFTALGRSLRSHALFVTLSQL